MKRKMECSVCFEAITDGQLIKLPNCTHSYHKQCIKQWLDQDKLTCPNCRVRVQQDTFTRLDLVPPSTHVFIAHDDKYDTFKNLPPIKAPRPACINFGLN